MALVTELVLETAAFAEREPRSVWGIAPVRETAEVGDALGAYVQGAVSETAVLDDTSYPDVLTAFREVATLNDAVSAGVTRVYEVRSRGFLDDRVTIGAGLEQVVSETAELNSYITSEVPTNLRESAALGDTASITITYSRNVRDGAQLNDRAAPSSELSVRDNVLIADTPTFRSVTRQTEREAAVLNDSATPVLLLNVLAKDAAELSDNVDITLLYELVARDTFYIQDIASGTRIDNSATTPAMDGTAYTCSTDSWAMSKLTNFPFLSMAGDKAAGANLWQLGGTSDNGAPLKSNIKTGFMDMGDTSLKRTSAMYFGGTASRPMTVDVTGDVNGVSTTESYGLSIRAQDDYRSNRVLLGKGFRSRYIQVNISATDTTYNLVSVEADVAKTNRRF